jgi:hypothetical protein
MSSEGTSELLFLTPLLAGVEVEQELLRIFQKLAETTPETSQQQLGYFENLVDWARFNRARQALALESEKADNILLEEAAAMMGVVVSVAILAGLYAPSTTPISIAATD